MLLRRQSSPHTHVMHDYSPLRIAQGGRRADIVAANAILLPQFSTCGNKLRLFILQLCEHVSRRICRCRAAIRLAAQYKDADAQRQEETHENQPVSLLGIHRIYPFRNR